MFTLVTSCLRNFHSVRLIDLIQIMGHEFNALPNPDNFFRYLKKHPAFSNAQGTGRTRQHLGCWPPPRSSDFIHQKKMHVLIHFFPSSPHPLATLFWSISVSPRPIVSRTTKDPLSASYLHPSQSKFYPPKKSIFRQFIPLFCGKKNIQFSVVCGASWWSPSLSPQRLSGSIVTTEAPKHNSLLRQVALAVSSPWLRVKLQPHWKTVRGNFYTRKTWQNRSA